MSDTRRPRRIDALSFGQNGSEVRVAFATGRIPSPYLVVAEPAVRRPAVRSRVFDDFENLPRRLDYLVIAPDTLRPGAEDLAAYRRAQGLSAAVVGLEAIYDAYAFGRRDPQAVKRFLAEISLPFHRAPRFVALIGDGHYDYQDRLGVGANPMPPLLVPTAYGLMPSDNAFSAVHPDAPYLPFSAVGRIPAMTSQELADYVAKVRRFETGPAPRKGLLIADNADAVDDFPAQGDGFAAALHGTGTALESSWLGAPYDVAGLRSRLLAGWQEGPLFIGYTGHGGIDRLAGEGLLTLADLPSLAGSGTPLLAAAACYVSFFALPEYDGLGEELVLLPNGGTVAVWGASGLAASAEARTLVQSLLVAVASSSDGTGERRLGDLTRQVLRDHAWAGGMPEMILLHNLLGDPALRLP